jgi:cytochrome c553
VTGNLPAGCTGTPATAPVLSTTCTPPPPACTLAAAVPTCSSCHGGGSNNAAAPTSHAGRPATCATCHGPTNNGSGTPSVGMVATQSGTACVLTYPFGGTSTHNNGTVNFGSP